MDRLLRAAFERLVRAGNLRISTASGTTFTFGDGTGTPVAIRFTTRAAERGALLDPELRFGEAYMDGEIVVEQGSIADFLDLAVHNLSRKPPNARGRALRWLRSFARRLFQDNSLWRSRRNAVHHYNIDYRIYRLFLDSDLQYSCAYFESRNASLDEAQLAKKRHIAGKLLLKPGLKVLDIGSGWGGLGLDLARNSKVSVVGINLSDEQVSIARQRAAAEGLPCEFRIQDYRNVSEKFDRIVSVGMFEHVGRQHYDEFLQKCRDLLTDDGVMLLHTVGRWNGPADTNAWVWRYIFPGGYSPALSELAPVIERSGLIMTDIEVLRIHYAETLHAWRSNFLAHRDEVVRLFEEDASLRNRFGSAERFIRMWEYYLAGFEASFRHYGLVVFQIQLAKNFNAVPITRGYMYKDKDRTANLKIAAAAE
ncbi:MAG TPA: cyclopropane-fatty-acyl-phospholipid synthase family protein [Xanthobacteraceae bacterium]|nr:cyclopropane-fatty-acyl-phospholipid synthase family protein [Xanthobacteraceae bacterium]